MQTQATSRPIGASRAFDLVLNDVMDAEEALAEKNFVRVLELLGQIRATLANTLV